MDTTSVEQIAERVEAEFLRLRAAWPALSSRIERAEHIVLVHLSCRGQRTIRVRVAADGQARFLVSGTGGAVYAVEPASWQCSCPDAHRRGKGCKHSIACWALERASHEKPAQPARGEGLEHVGDVTARVLARTVAANDRECAGCGGLFHGRDFYEVGDDNLTFSEGDELCHSCAGAHGVL